NRPLLMLLQFRLKVACSGKGNVFYGGAEFQRFVSTSPFKFISLTHFRLADGHWH
ncbi:hypothetical protein BGY98DRAFT_962109, partial [Russula aff. rugulosa BPL654]